MTGHELLDKRETDGQELRRKHEIVALWFFLGLLVAICIALAWAEGHGFWTGSDSSSAPWPTGWP